MPKGSQTQTLGFVIGKTGIWHIPPWKTCPETNRLRVAEVVLIFFGIPASISLVIFVGSSKGIVSLSIEQPVEEGIRKLANPKPDKLRHLFPQGYSHHSGVSENGVYHGISGYEYIHKIAI